MKYIVDYENDVGDGHFYTSVAQHRHQTNNEKSRWIISIEDEINCFNLSRGNKWNHPGNNKMIGWGYISDNGRFKILGENLAYNDLKIAKFFGINNKWHGFPADYRNNETDRPPTNILQEWVNKSKMRKIRNGQKCNL